MNEITLSAKILEAVAKWASPDPGHPRSCIRIRDGELYATDGHRLVRVPVGDKEIAMAIQRDHVFAAVAVLKSLRGFGDIRLMKKGERIHMALGSLTLSVPAGKDDDIDRDRLDAVEATKQDGSPDGILFDPRYLAAIEDIRTALGSAGGVKISGWGGAADPMTFELRDGVRCTVMPMRDA